MVRVILLALILLVFCSPGLSGDGKVEGESVGRQFLERYGSGAGIQSKFASPLTSAQKMDPLLSGFYRCQDTGKVYQSLSECSWSCSSYCVRGFDAQVTSPSPDPFLELFIQPSSTGDIARTIVRQDLDFDGRFDHAYIIPVYISGVCANGYISCAPGTWSNCRYFVWSTDSQGRVISEEVPHITGYLGGCYCINRSCGAGSNVVWSNASQILEHLGGGAVGAVQSRDSHVAVTGVKVELSELKIKYWGQRSETAARYSGASNYVSGLRNPEVYYQNPALLDAAVEEEQRQQLQDPSSIYWLVTQSPAAKSESFELRSCVVKRDWDISKKSEVIGFDVKVLLQVDHNGDSEWCQWVDALSGRCGRCIICCPDDINMWNDCIGHVNRYKREITMQIYYNTSTCVPYTDPYTGQTGCYTPSGIPLAFSDTTTQEVGCWVKPRCCPDWPPYNCFLMTWEAYMDNPDKCAGTRKEGGLIFCADERPYLLKTDTCSGGDFSGCRLKDEQICDAEGRSCIWTVRSFSKTGIKPLPDCVQKGSDLSGAVWTVCVDGMNMTYASTAGQVGILETGEDVWWVVKRTYYCPGQNPYDLESAKKRMPVLEPSVSFSGSTLTYTDYLPQTGTRYSGSIELWPMDDQLECEMVCKVRVGVPETQAGSYGHQGQYLVSTESIRDEYRVCELDSSGAWVCPYDPSRETRLKNCGCLNAFNEAITGMQLLRDASKDVICSTTPPN